MFLMLEGRAVGVCGDRQEARDRPQFQLISPFTVGLSIPQVALSLPLSVPLPWPLATGGSFAHLAGCLGPGSPQNLKEEGAFSKSTVTSYSPQTRPRTPETFLCRQGKGGKLLRPSTSVLRPENPPPHPPAILPESWRSQSPCNNEGRQTSSPRRYLGVV